MEPCWRRNVRDILDVDGRPSFGDLAKRAECHRPRAVDHANAGARREAPDPHVVRFVLRQLRGATRTHRRAAEKRCYSGRATVVHHSSSMSSRSTRHPAFARDETNSSRSSTRIPEKIETPSAVSAARIAGSSEMSVDETILATTRCTGETCGRIVSASPSMATTRSLTPFVRTFSSAFPIASGSDSIPATREAPRCAAAIASTPLPVPRSARRSGAQRVLHLRPESLLASSWRRRATLSQLPHERLLLVRKLLRCPELHADIQVPNARRVYARKPAPPQLEDLATLRTGR